MLSLLSLNNFKSIAIGLAIIAGVWYYKDAEKAKADLKVQTENSAMIRKFDSLKYASVTYSKAELDEYLEYQRKDLQQFLKENKIKTRNIEQIITQKLEYLDNINRKTDLQPILDAISQRKDIKVPIIDSTKCLVVKGFVVFKNDTLSLDITDRQFKNRSDIVSYWEKNQWNFLGIKTRFLGKKSLTVIIKDDCGNTETFIIGKKEMK